MVIHARSCLTVALVSVVLGIIGALLLPAFTDGDQSLIVSVFAASAVAALVWLAIRGMPQNMVGWIAPLIIAFGPAYLLAAYMAVILSTPPGFIHVI